MNIKEEIKDLRIVISLMVFLIFLIPIAVGSFLHKRGWMWRKKNTNMTGGTM